MFLYDMRQTTSFLLDNHQELTICPSLLNYCSPTHLFHTPISPRFKRFRRPALVLVFWSTNTTYQAVQQRRPCDASDQTSRMPISPNFRRFKLQHLGILCNYVLEVVRSPHSRISISSCCQK